MFVRRKINENGKTSDLKPSPLFGDLRPFVSVLSRHCIQFLLLWLLSLTGPLGYTAEAQKRVALVIGNSRYEPSIGPLRNTVNDAKTMARTLRAIGFTVIEEHNVTRDALMTSVLKFREKLRGAEVGLFYFAGHGISIAGANYLLPTRTGFSPDATDGTSRRLLAETKLFNAEQVVAEMSNASVGCSLVILDACRVTPVARNPAHRDAASAGGLVEMNPPAGSLIAFSTDAGRVASDGAGANGIYTAELIKHLQTPGLTIEQVFKRTRAGVITLTSGAQIPAEYSRLIGDDIFLAGREAVKAPEEVIPKGRPIPLPSFADIHKFAAKGETVKCLEALRLHARIGPVPKAAEPLKILLDHAKESLRDAKTATPKADSTLQTCDLLLSAVGELLPSEHPQRPVLIAKAQNRRGDALLLLGKIEDALQAFDAALALTPDDAYVLYNRGAALLRLDRKDEAKAEFRKVIDAKPKQPGARKLATEALAGMK